jgi:hypothetical protein
MGYFDENHVTTISFNGSAGKKIVDWKEARP